MRILSVLQRSPRVFSDEAGFWIRMMPKLRERGLEVDVLTQNSDGEVVLDNASDVVTPGPRGKWLHPGSYGNYLTAVVGTVLRTRGRYEAIVFHGPNQDAFYATVATRPVLGTRIVYKMTLMGDDDPRTIRGGGRCGWQRLWLLRRADIVVSISPAATTSALLAGVDRGRLWEIPQGIDVTRFVPHSLDAKHAIREREGLPLEAPIVLFAGALGERGGVDLLLRAWPTVLNGHPTSVLLLVGPEGDDANCGQQNGDASAFVKKMKRLASTPEYRSSVRFLGLRQDIAQILPIANIFAFPSRAEGVPNALLEAMAAGVPCVVSDLPGVAGAAVRHEREGLVVPMESWRDLAASLKRLLAEPSIARSLGQNGRIQVASNFSQDGTADLYVKLFQNLCGRAEVRGAYQVSMPRWLGVAHSGRGV